MSYSIFPFVLVILIILTIFVLIIVYRSRCPKCKRFFAQNLVNKRIDSTKSYEDLKVVDNKNEIVKTTITSYTSYYECKHCGHKWHKTGKNKHTEDVK